MFIQVMIQPQNRQISFSLYISALAVADTVVLLAGKWIRPLLKNWRDKVNFTPILWGLALTKIIG